MDRPDPGIESERKHLKAVRDFFFHLMVFLFVCGLMVSSMSAPASGDRQF